MRSRPNFLVIMTDQHRADHLGCGGNGILKTPHIDSLASRGTVFDRCYVAAPVCMANRSSFMTGRMPSLHGVRHNGIPLAFGNRTFVEVLRAAGYRTALIGKSHLQNMQDLPPRMAAERSEERRLLPGHAEARKENLDSPDYEQELPTRWDDPAHRIRTPFYGFDQVELCDEHGDLAFGDYLRWLLERAPDALTLRGAKHAQATDYVAPQAWRTRVPEELYPSSYIAERASAFIAGQRGSDEPFFLMCSFPDPHHPFTPPGRYWDMYAPGEITLPAALHHPPELSPPPLAWLHAERAAGKAPVKSHRVFAVTEREAREAIALTYGMIGMIDDMVGRIIEALRLAGTLDDTIVVFTSDHGDYMGDHGLLLKGPLHYDGLVRVPFLWADPAVRGSRRSKALTSTIDIPETILHRAGLASPNGMQGKSLLGLTDGRTEKVRDALLIEDEYQRVFLGFENRVRLRTLITEDIRLSLFGGSSYGEAYDLKNDPREFRNLWSEPGFRETRVQLVDQLARVMMDSADASPSPTRLA